MLGLEIHSGLTYRFTYGPVINILNECVISVIFLGSLLKAELIKYNLFDYSALR